MKKTFNTLPELFNEMFTLGIHNMESNLRDILVDKNSIQMRVDYDEPIDDYWVVRKHGTHNMETVQAAAEKAQWWKCEYSFTAHIKGNSGEFDKYDYKYSLEIIDGTAK